MNLYALKKPLGMLRSQFQLLVSRKADTCVIVPTRTQRFLDPLINVVMFTKLVDKVSVNIRCTILIES